MKKALRNTLLLSTILSPVTTISKPALAQDWQRSIQDLLGGNQSRDERDRLHQAWQRGYQHGYDDAMQRSGERRDGYDRDRERMPPPPPPPIYRDR